MSQAEQFQRPIPAAARRVSDLGWHEQQATDCRERLASAHLSQAGERAWKRSLAHHLEVVERLRRSADLEALGIAAGVGITARSLKAAFRRKAQTAHPDGGGSAEAFRVLTDAYERLSAAIARGRR